MHMSLIDRRISKIVNARSVTFGLATTFFLLSLAAAVVTRIVDHHDFPSLGLAVWWSLQTVTVDFSNFSVTGAGARCPSA